MAVSAGRAPDGRAARHVIDVVDAEAGGDVSRVIVGGVAPPPGATMIERMRWLRSRADGLRRLLLYPPRGEPSMSANLVVPAIDPGADLGFLIMEAMGYPAFSGSNAMCTAAVLLETGRLQPPRGRRAVVLESPAGTFALQPERGPGGAGRIGYRAPPAFVARRDRVVEVPGHGRIGFDVVYGGVFYALVDARRLGLDPRVAGLDALASCGAALVEAARPSLRLRHPDYGAAGPLSFVLFVGESAGGEWPLAAYVHPGVICHGPSGTGTSALLAWLAAGGRIAPGARLRTVSPEGGSFEGRLLGDARVGRRTAFVTEIRGEPRLLGSTRVAVDASDPLLNAACRDLLAAGAREPAP